MTEPPVVRFVAKHLELGLSSISAEQKDRLQNARTAALAKRKTRSSIQWASVLGIFQMNLVTQRALARTAAVLLITGVVSIWHAERFVMETAELDSAILADDVPMDVLTDKGFDQWLKSSGGQ